MRHYRSIFEGSITFPLTTHAEFKEDPILYELVHYLSFNTDNNIVLEAVVSGSRGDTTIMHLLDKRTDLKGTVEVDCHEFNYRIRREDPAFAFRMILSMLDHQIDYFNRQWRQTWDGVEDAIERQFENDRG